MPHRHRIPASLVKWVTCYMQPDKVDFKVTPVISKDNHWKLEHCFLFQTIIVWLWECWSCWIRKMPFGLCTIQIRSCRVEDGPKLNKACMHVYQAGKSMLGSWSWSQLFGFCSTLIETWEKEEKINIVTDVILQEYKKMHLWKGMFFTNGSFISWGEIPFI